MNVGLNRSILSDVIRIAGAREHNLKSVDLELPRNALVVFTGVSGSGKSSLAFDTIYAEGQRRYVESLSAYARQFLGQMEKPDVDSIEGLSPAISIDQKGTSRNPRSTVGTITEVYDYLRLLYARVGQLHCPSCGRPISRQTTDQMADRIGELPAGTRIVVLAPVVQGRKGEYRDLLAEMRRSGFVRVRVDGQMHQLEDEIALDKNKRHDLEVVVDRLVVDQASRLRLVESIETAANLAEGTVVVSCPDQDSEIFMSREYACARCGISVEQPEPRNFSFNSPHGACPRCTGLGSKLVVDPALVVPDPELSIAQGAISGWAHASYFYPDLLESTCRQFGIDQQAPFSTLSEKHRQLLLYGSRERVAFAYTNRHGQRKTHHAAFEGVIPNLQRRHHDTESEFMRQEIEKFMSLEPCPACEGRRLRPESLAVTVGGLNLAQLCALAVAPALDFLGRLELGERDSMIAGGILKEIGERLGFLVNVGLDYLTLDRSSTTLSGGESQRIRLATQIGSHLMGVIYVLDEPSIGLHQRDNRKLIDTLVALRDLGNTLIVVEHDEETIRSADHIVDFGPGAGEHGGRIVFSGPLEGLLESSESVTAAFLRGDQQVSVSAGRRPGNGHQLGILGAAENNLKAIDVYVPLGTFTCVSGVSGSGKSSLVTDILWRQLQQHFHRSRHRPGKHTAVVGLEHIDKVVNVDQSPIGRTPRSNPATYTGVFTHIRELFASLPEARMRGYRPGRFSFNVHGGRCEACQGDGIIQIEMHFLPDVYVPCEVCHGRRYSSEALEVRFRGHSIADVLDLSVDDAMGVFENIPRILSKMRTLHDVGLGYIRLGQPATTLSGGEAQRVKLSTELSRRDTGRTLYLLDEPTTGLHFADVKRLLAVLDRLVDHGNTVVVIEHNLDVIKHADWIIDLGPEGGDGGGRLVAEGTPEQVSAWPGSHTGRYLDRLLGQPPSRPTATALGHQDPTPEVASSRLSRSAEL